MLLLAGLLVIGVVLPVSVGAFAGSLEIPRNDDWAYRRLALELAETGALALNVTTMIIGQILITQPLLWLSGLGPWAFAAAGVLFAISGVVGAYSLARQLLAPPRAAIAAAVLLLFPGYLAYATSYMSDVPALAAQLVCLALGAVALRRRPVSSRWLLASLAVGCVGYSIRDFALAAPVAVVLATICADYRRPLHWAAAVAVAGGFGLLYLLRAVLMPLDQAVIPASGGIGESFQALAILALVVSPAAVAGAVSWRHHWHRVDVAVGAQVGLLVVGGRLLQWHNGGTVPPVILPNLASRWGSPTREMFLGDRPLLFDEASWVVVNAMALVATVVVLAAGSGIAGAYLRRSPRSVRAIFSGLGSSEGLLALFTVGASVGLTVYGLNNHLFDRYLWPLVPPMATLLMHVPRAFGRDREAPHHRTDQVLAALVVLLLGLLCTVSLALMLNANAFDAARWHAGERLAESGVRPDEIDAGYEWVGLHATTPLSGGGSHPVFYRRYWPAFRECGLVTSEEVASPTVELVGTIRYSLYLIAGPEQPLYLYRLTGPECSEP